MLVPLALALADDEVLQLPEGLVVPEAETLGDQEFVSDADVDRLPVSVDVPLTLVVTLPLMLALAAALSEPLRLKVGLPLTLNETLALAVPLDDTEPLRVNVCEPLGDGDALAESLRDAVREALPLDVPLPLAVKVPDSVPLTDLLFDRVHDTLELGSDGDGVAEGDMLTLTLLVYVPDADSVTDSDSEGLRVPLAVELTERDGLLLDVPVPLND